MAGFKLTSAGLLEGPSSSLSRLITSTCSLRFCIAVLIRTPSKTQNSGHNLTPPARLKAREGYAVLRKAQVLSERRLSLMRASASLCIKAAGRRGRVQNHYSIAKGGLGKKKYLFGSFWRVQLECTDTVCRLPG